MMDLKLGQKRRQLENAFKKAILEGRYPAGGRLPTMEELGKSFDASLATLQHVLARLKQDGYTTSVERQGTFVCERIPARCRIGLAFRIDENENSFWRKIAAKALEYNRSSSFYQFVPLRGRVMDVPQSEEYAELAGQLERRRLAAVFVPHRLDKTLRVLVERHPETPLLTFTGNTPEGLVRRELHLSPRRLARLALEHFRKQGIVRVAALFPGSSTQAAAYREECSALGMFSPPEWTLPFDKERPEAAGLMVKLLMSLPLAARPRGIYVSDDNLSEHVQRAVLELGVKVPDEVSLVSHANFPEEVSPVLPMERVGYDVGDIIEGILELARRAGGGEEGEPVVVPARHERDAFMRRQGEEKGIARVWA